MIRSMRRLLEILKPVWLQPATIPTLIYWKNRVEKAGGKNAEQLKRQLIDEFNALGIKGMPKVEKLYALVGSYVNLAYPLPSGHAVPFLDDRTTYFGCQIEGENKRCFGLLGNESFLLVSTYGENGGDPELILYKKR